MNWKPISEIVMRLGLRSRIQMKGALDDAAWSSFLIVPCGGYIESQQGPVREEDVEFLAVDCLKRLKRGLRLKEEVADKLGELAAALENEGVGFRAVGALFIFPAQKANYAFKPTAEQALGADRSTSCRGGLTRR